jgi:hypothetical protein
MTAVRLMVVKDLRILLRSRVLLAALVLYPLLLAVLLALVADALLYVLTRLLSPWARARG